MLLQGGLPRVELSSYNVYSPPKTVLSPLAISSLSLGSNLKGLCSIKIGPSASDFLGEKPGVVPFLSYYWCTE